MATRDTLSKRRTFLKGTGAAAAFGLAGCLGDGDGIDFHFLSATPEEPEALPDAVEAWADDRDEDIDLTMEFVGVVDAEPDTAEYISIGEPPSVVIGNAPLAQFHGNLADVSEINEELGLDDPAYGAQVGDKQVIVPEHFIISARFYRKDLYDEAGVEPATTWEEQGEVNEALAETIPDEMHPELIQANGDNTGIYLQDQPTHATLGVDFIERTGEDLEDVRVSLGDEDERQAAIDILTHYNEMYQYSPDTVSYDFFDMTLTYLEETVATTNYTGRTIDDMYAQAPDLIENTGVAPFAMPEDAGEYMVGHNPQALAIPETDHTDLALDFVSFYFDSDYYFDRLLEAGPNSVPVTLEQLNDDYIQSHESWDNPLGQEYREYIEDLWENDQLYPAQYGRTDPPSPYWPDIVNEPPRIAPHMSAYGYSGEKEPAEAVDDAAEELEDRLENVLPDYLED